MVDWPQPAERESFCRIEGILIIWIFGAFGLILFWYMWMRTVLTICQIFTGALALLDYFIPKERIQQFELRARIWIERNSGRIESIPDKFRIHLTWPFLALVVVLAVAMLRGHFHELSAHAKAETKSAFPSTEIAVLYWGMVISAVLIVIFQQIEHAIIAFTWLLRFAAWCPKGVIAGISFPAFLIITVAKVL